MKLYSQAALAERLGRSAQTIRNWVTRGLLRPAGTVRIHNQMRPVYRLTDARRIARQRPSLFREVRRSIRMPSTPTDTLPGTPERMKVYEERVARNERIFHPRDRKYAH